MLQYIVDLCGIVFVWLRDILVESTVYSFISFLRINPWEQSGCFASSWHIVVAAWCIMEDLVLVTFQICSSRFYCRMAGTGVIDDILSVWSLLF